MMYARIKHYTNYLLPRAIVEGVKRTKRWWTIYPNESEYASQSFWKGVNPWYANWLESRSLDAQNRTVREYYNLDWNDITYPHLSSVSGGNTARSMGQLARSSWQFSKNLHRLYR